MPNWYFVLPCFLLIMSLCSMPIDGKFIYESADAFMKIEGLPFFDIYWREILNVGAKNAGTMHDREQRAFYAGMIMYARLSLDKKTR